MSTLTLHRTHRRSWELTDGATPRGTLHAGRGLVRAEATTTEGSWALRSQGNRRCRIVAGPAGATAVELEPPLARLAGRDAPAHWSVGRGLRHYRGVLTDGDREISARTVSGRAGTIRVEVAGVPSDLLVVTVCFALLSRRHQDRMRALWIAAITSHGPR
ncbi:hypothetical protein [Micromonospora siamensis]|uniref:Uncharacterized protein n=1 Tax=Micromonospora siamensis TaxID=299152 RepID=A0A1C5ILE6_9ACTN|nr:hypothetical protein [Micromonospora siamensis]SCG59160.1 hypothetical protein GA0074704_3569 [Micromonospora siamensis]